MPKALNTGGPFVETHEQQHHRFSNIKAASPTAMHQALGYDTSSIPAQSSKDSPALEPMQLSAEDRATFATLKKPEARCCLESFQNVPSEALVYFEYFNQGGANVIFKIFPWASHSRAERGRPFFFVDAKIDSLEVIPIHHHELVDKVLRVNKGLSKTLRCEEVISGFYSHVWPLFMPKAAIVVLHSTKITYKALSIALSDRDFTEHLMEHRGVKLFSSVMVDLTSKSDAIGVEEGQDQEQRDLTTKRWGILLPDMSPTAGSSITLEVKPKWLAQSPTAPPDAVRCRTCALQVAKPKDSDKYICPLRLLNGSWDHIYPWILARVTEQVAEHASKTSTPDVKVTNEIASHVTTYLFKGDGKALLQHLSFLQKNLDPNGILCRSRMEPKETKAIFSRNLRLAMTLRDCSLYIRVGYTSSGVDPSTIDCKLGDLDFKSADKMDDWEDKENGLLKATAYTRKIDEDLGCLVAKSLGTKK
jgi:inositol-pentakisphosphate 2-kinase